MKKVKKKNTIDKIFAGSTIVEDEGEGEKEEQVEEEDKKQEYEGGGIRRRRRWREGVFSANATFWLSFAMRAIGSCCCLLLLLLFFEKEK